MMLSPPFLKKGDTVMLLSTARKTSEDIVQNAVLLYESWGLKVIQGNTLTTEHHQFAGNDRLRSADLQAALNNPEIKAIFCARGGYGTVRIIDDLDFTAFLKSPKWIVGFSDVTYLHSLLNNQLYVQSLHAAMPSTFPTTNPSAVDAIRAVLFGKKIAYPITPSPHNKEGKMCGEVIGGNLSILYSITGTKSGFDTTGKILFIEDLDEYLYHIDRMILNLKRSGKLTFLEGLIVGGMSQLHDNDVPFGCSIEEIILEHTAEYSYPICFGFPAGHIAENWPVILGKKMELEITKRGTFKQ